MINSVVIYTTTYCFVGKPIEINHFYEKLKQHKILTELSEVFRFKPHPYCNGQIDYIDTNYKSGDSKFYITTETRIEPMHKVFEDILGGFYPSIECFWQVNEPQQKVFETNDTTGEYFPEKYILIHDFVNKEYKHFHDLVKFETEESLLVYANYILNQHFTTIPQINDYAKLNIKEPEVFEIHEYEIKGGIREMVW